MPTASKQMVVRNSQGLHARPAIQFAQLANQFASRVTVLTGGEEPAEADGKSVVQMIMLAATQGTPLRIEADGDDAEAAVAKLSELVEDNFGEDGYEDASAGGKPPVDGAPRADTHPRANVDQ
jgi:phosphocarrier protein HPr